MKNINLIPIILIAFMTLVFSSCQKNEEVFSKSQNVTAEDKPENNRNSANNHNVNIYEEYYMNNIYNSSNIIMEKCVESTVDIDDLAFDNPQVFCEQIGIDIDYYNQLNETIQNSINSIKRMHPEISTYSNMFTCSTCEHEDNIERVKNYIRYFKTNNSVPISIKYMQENAPFIGNGNTSDQVNAGCSDYFNYTLCLIVCTASGPVIYWICVYACLCHYCPQFCIHF